MVHARISFGTTLFLLFEEAESGRESIDKSEFVSSSDTMRWAFAVGKNANRQYRMRKSLIFKMLRRFYLKKCGENGLIKT